MKGGVWCIYYTCLNRQHAEVAGDCLENDQALAFCCSTGDGSVTGWLADHGAVGGMPRGLSNARAAAPLRLEAQLVRSSVLQVPQHVGTSQEPATTCHKTGFIFHLHPP